MVEMEVKASVKVAEQAIIAGKGAWFHTSENFISLFLKGILKF